MGALAKKGQGPDWTPASNMASSMFKFWDMI